MSCICIGDPTSLFRLQNGVLRGVAAALECSTLPSGGAPTRQYVSVGDPAFDCSQLVVYATNLRMSPDYIYPDGRRMMVSEYLVDITVVLLRCFPTGESITPAALQQVAEILNMDAALMYFGFECKLLRGEIPDISCTDCKLYAPGILNPITPQAGLGGWNWTWTFVIPSC